MRLLERWDDLSETGRAIILIVAFSCLTTIACVALLVMCQVLVTAGI